MITATPLSCAALADRPATRPLRVVVADDHPLYRESIVRALAGAGDLVVGECADGRSALEAIERLRPDVALVDVRMPDLDGIDVVDALSRQGPDVPVVLLSAFDDEPLVRAGMQAGAAAYLTKEADRDAILRVVDEAATPSRAPRALAGADTTGSPDPRRLPRLTGDEHRLLRLAQAGMTDRSDLADQTGFDEARVRATIHRLLGKLHADTPAEAVVIAERGGLLAPKRPGGAS